jgi:hypothetical protein
MSLDSFKAILHRVRRQRSEKGTNQIPQQPSATPKAATNAPDTAAPSDAGSKPVSERPPKTSRGQVFVSDQKALHVPISQPPPSAQANGAPAPVTFTPSIERPAPKIDVAPGVQPFTPGNVIRTYSSSTPEARRKIRAFREAEWGRDVDNSTGGSQSDEHDDFERR